MGAELRLPVPDPAGGRRRTKIVATIGPATRSVETIAELIRSGADVFRLNFSHGSREDHAATVAMAREASGVAGREVGLLGDLPGPKLRIGEVEGGLVELQSGSELTLMTGEELGTAARLPVSWAGLPAAVSEGAEVFLADGRVRLRVLGAASNEIRCKVEVGGAVTSHQGLNLPGTDVPLPSASRTDLDWVDFAVEQGIDLLAVSFVRRAEDLQPVERRVRVAGADIPLIAKIEKPQGAENAEAIIQAALSGIMVARGDLGIELPIERVPAVQKRLRSGRTARLVSAHRPSVPVLAVSPRIETVRRLQLLFGVSCVLAENWTSLRALLDDCARLARETGVAASGELIGITAGLPEQELGTNLFEVHRVP
jgi:pyruvate kinase